VRLRPLLRLSSLALALASVLPGCASCIDQPAQPVVLRVVNKLAWPIYVQDDLDQAGLTVQRDAPGGWTDAKESATCACQECSQICTGCTCPTVEGWARRIQPGASVERTWAGEYRANDKVRCYGGPAEPCLGKRQAAQAGTWRLKLCWATSLPTTPPDQERFQASFPSEGTLSCVTRTFDLPATGPVEILTDAPPGCTVATDCTGGQMCLGGQCSSTCLPNAVPKLTGEWGLEIGVPDNAGFFEVQPGTVSGSVVFRGAGKVTTVRYNAGTTNLTVSRVVNGLDYTGSIYYTLPGRRALPLLVGDPVELTVVDFQSGPRKRARGLVLKVDGKVALIADNGFYGKALEATHLAPFEVDVAGAVFACDAADCGMRSHRRTLVRVVGEPQVVEAGKALEFADGEDTWEFVSVANYLDEVADCGPSPMTPFALIFQRPTN